MRLQPKYFETKDLSLASALLTLGIPFDEETPLVNLKTPYGNQTIFYFSETSQCGKYDAAEMSRFWNNPTFVIEYPEHPLAYIKCAYKNRDGLLDYVKQGLELAVMETNGKLVIISKSASPEFQKEIFSKL